jgi:TolB protein
MADLRRLLPILLALVLPAGVAHAQLTVEITQGVTSPIPVAVVPFTGEAAPPDVAGVIEADLARSGRFAALPRAAMPQRPTVGTAPDLAQWRMVRSDFVVVGRVRREGDRQAIDFELYSATTGARLAGSTVSVAAGELRLGAHRAADLIYEKILGVPGAFATRLAYVLVEGPPATRRWKLVVADADGENAVPIFSSGQPVMSPSWSPDGSRLAYVSFEGHASSIWVQNVSAGTRQKVSSWAGINGAPAWSPDGSRLAVALSQKDGNVDVFVLDLATHAPQRITEDPAIDTEPCFSPDGRSLYFTSDRAGRPQIYRIGLGGGGRAQRVTFEGNYNARPRVSPDGTQVAVVTQDQGAYRIAVVDATSGRSRVLTSGRLDEGPSFAPNGQTIVFAAREHGRGVLQTVAVDSGVTSRISVASGDVREPAWSPRL